MGTATVQAQHAAERLGLPFEHMTFEYGDSNLPSGTMGGGSSQSASIIAAVTAATEELTKQLLKHACNDSPLAGLKPSQVEPRRWPVPAS
jgi:xanthine dehydrogenase YagR molybdenum-binding subunit